MSKLSRFKIANIIVAWYAMITYQTGGSLSKIQATTRAGPFPSVAVCEQFITWAKVNISTELKNFPCQFVEERSNERKDYENPEIP